VEPTGSLPQSQQPATCSSPEPDQASPCPLFQVLTVHFNIIFVSWLKLPSSMYSPGVTYCCNFCPCSEIWIIQFLLNTTIVSHELCCNIYLTYLIIRRKLDLLMSFQKINMYITLRTHHSQTQDFFVFTKSNPHTVKNLYKRNSSILPVPIFFYSSHTPTLQFVLISSLNKSRQDEICAIR
jgi:hypothetical protein